MIKIDHFDQIWSFDQVWGLGPTLPDLTDQDLIKILVKFDQIRSFLIIF